MACRNLHDVHCSSQEIISERFFVERAESVQDGTSPLVLAMRKAYKEEHSVVDNEGKLKSSYYDSNYNDSNYRPGDDLILTLIDEESGTRMGIEAFKMTTLMCAINYKRGYEVIHRLICLERNINAKCCDDKTALIYAVWNNYGAAVIREIIDRGADVDCDVLSVAVYVNRPEIVELLIDAKADNVDLDSSEQSVFVHVKCLCCEEDNCSFKETIDTLVRRGFDLAKIDSEGDTIIHFVDCSYLIGLVIKCGLSVDTENLDGYSPLYEAIKSQDVHKISCLIMLGANSDCLDFAVKMNSCKLIINLLVYNKARISIEFVKSILSGSCPVRICRGFFYNNYNIANSFVLQNYFLFFCNTEFSEEEFNYFFQYTELDMINCRKFVTECKKEISEMREMLITDKLTFYDFCMMNKVKQSKCVDVPSVALQYDYEQIRDFFPVYENIIILRMKDSRTEYLRRVLRKALEKITIRPLSDDGSVSCIKLSYDCFYHLSCYLNKKDLYKLFRTSIDSDSASSLMDKQTRNMILVKENTDMDFPYYLRGYPGE